MLYSVAIFGEFERKTYQLRAKYRATGFSGGSVILELYQVSAHSNKGYAADAAVSGCTALPYPDYVISHFS